ncbi:hypothetical protein TNCT_404391 [Trichonephila clavata]|uniref:Uncharacterized protein n=1 Tax=Trichonephila clavata TaxID=2740835 RepID=A0A8X6IEV3_TRICU|nr:hypothetical protein TNCT_404391 [Trichonephila clavata]
MPDERSQGPLVVWKPVLLVKVLKIFMDSFKPLFVVMDAFLLRRYPAVHGQVGGIVLLSRETCTVGKPFHCVQGFKHCIVILKGPRCPVTH